MLSRICIIIRYRTYWWFDDTDNDTSANLCIGMRALFLHTFGEFWDWWSNRYSERRKKAILFVLLLSSPCPSPYPSFYHVINTICILIVYIWSTYKEVILYVHKYIISYKTTNYWCNIIYFYLLKLRIQITIHHREGIYHFNKSIDTNISTTGCN